MVAVKWSGLLWDVHRHLELIWTVGKGLYAAQKK